MRPANTFWIIQLSNSRAAVVHIAAAFKVITKLLGVLNMVNVPLFLMCTVATVAVFAVFYAAVFGVTAREYYRIVG